MGIAMTQREQHAFMATLIESFIAREQELADPIERVGLPAPVPERLVLDAPAHLVDAAVGDAHDVKGIGYPDGMVEVRGCAAAIALSEIRRHDSRMALIQAGSCSAHHLRRSAAAFPSTMSIMFLRLRSTRPVT